MHISIEHVTRYRYETDTNYSVQVLRLTPQSFDGQRVISWDVSAEPDGALTQSIDGFGNIVHLLTVHGEHLELEIRAKGSVETSERHGVISGLNEPVPLRVFLKQTPLTAPDDKIRDFVRSVEGQTPIAQLHGLMGLIRDAVEYETGTTTSATTAAEALASGSGVCQDHAHIFVSAARLAGIPARYVTGYLLTDDHHATAHHAWAETYVEGLGWVGFDVANRMCPTDRYVRLASALDALSATPIRGSRRGGATETLEVAVVVQQETQQQQ